MIAVEIAGDDALVDRLQAMPERIAARIASAMAGLGVDMRGLVQDSRAASGLRNRSGRLAQSIEVEADERSVSAVIDTSAVPYAAIQEYGGTTRPHVIEAINAAALRFQVGGHTVFAKRVMHPGSVIPAHSFMATALAGLAPVARDAMADAVAAEVQA